MLGQLLGILLTITGQLKRASLLVVTVRQINDFRLGLTILTFFEFLPVVKLSTSPPTSCRCNSGGRYAPAVVIIPWPSKYEGVGRVIVAVSSVDRAEKWF